MTDTRFKASFSEPTFGGDQQAESSLFKNVRFEPAHLDAGFFEELRDASFSTFIMMMP